MKKEKKITWSKGALLVSGLIFVAVLALVFYLYISGNIQNAYDVSLLVTSVTVSGAIFGSNLCWYSKKAGSENQYKLKMSLYEDSARVRLNFNEKMLQLSQKYNVSKEELYEIDQSGDMDDFMQSALSDASNKLDEQQADFESADQIENFSI